MIRLKIEKINQPLPLFPPARRVGDLVANDVTQLPQPPEEVTVLLLQELHDDVHVQGIIAFVNQLEMPTMCRCGHGRDFHLPGGGPCTVGDETHHIGAARCHCEKFESHQQFRIRQLDEALSVANTNLGKQDVEIEQLQNRAMDADAGNAAVTEKYHKLDKRLAKKNQYLEDLRGMYQNAQTEVLRLRQELNTIE